MALEKITSVAGRGVYLASDMELGWKDREALEPPVDDSPLEVWRG